VLDDGKSQQALNAETSNAPGLTIWLASDPNLGTLEVEANVPDADLFVDGRNRRPLRAGKSSIGLEPGTHVVRVEKDGYQEAADLRIEVKKGEKVPARFDLRALPKTASLVIEAGTPGAEVLVDGTPTGGIGANGSLRLDDIAPGNHTIT